MQSAHNEPITTALGRVVNQQHDSSKYQLTPPLAPHIAAAAADDFRSR